jgi:DNA-directed RNA polymerase subunit H (RpoH/RPB5)
MELLKPIQATGHVQWDIYNIVRKAFCPYRAIEVTTPPITQAELIKNMQFDMYVKIVGKVTRTGAKIVIAILGRNENGSNDIAVTTEKFRLFVNSIKEQDSQIIIISPCRFLQHILRYIQQDPKLNRRISRYNYDHFKVVVPLGPYCSRHTILSPEAAAKEIETHKLDPKEMKKIMSSDPQCIWLGAVPGDIILIDRLNPLTGRSTDFRKCVYAPFD